MLEDEVHLWILIFLSVRGGNTQCDCTPSHRSFINKKWEDKTSLNGGVVIDGSNPQTGKVHVNHLLRGWDDSFFNLATVVEMSCSSTVNSTIEVKHKYVGTQGG